ncbi:MAG: hypothetical protein ACEPO2_01045 [Pelagibaca sp.]
MANLIENNDPLMASENGSAAQSRLLYRHGHIETHEVFSEASGRRRIAVDTETQSRFDEGWHDWPDAVQRAKLVIALPERHRVFAAPALILSGLFEPMARRLGVEYAPPEDPKARREYETWFRTTYGSMAAIWDLDFPWSEMNDGEIGEVIYRFGVLLDASGCWGGGGIENTHYSMLFRFLPRSSKGRAWATFELKKGASHYRRIE